MSNAPEIARIELRLRELAQLFNSMDPSPFIDRDLDADAEEFIVSWARELPTHCDLELMIHLTTPPAPERAAHAESAVRHYFATRAAIKQSEFRLLMHRGRLSLVVGLLFLTVCLTLGELATKLGYQIADHVIAEGLTIVGWVAMWRPLQIYLYDWWPLRDDRRIYERLARMRMRVVPPASMGETGDVRAAA
jgi:hypothetical protein